jgi:hypothetical protein
MAPAGNFPPKPVAHDSNENWDARGNESCPDPLKGRQKLKYLHKWFLCLESFHFVLKVKFQITLILMMVQEKVEALVAIPALSLKKNLMTGMMKTLWEMIMIRPVWLP